MALFSEVFDLSVLAAAGCVIAFILLMIVGSLLEKRMKAGSRIGGVFIKAFFVVFVLLGFSLVPIMVGIVLGAFEDVIPAAEGAKLPAVLLMWGVYAIGLVMAYPVMMRSGFFRPKQ